MNSERPFSENASNLPEEIEEILKYQHFSEKFQAEDSNDSIKGKNVSNKFVDGSNIGPGSSLVPNENPSDSSFTGVLLVSVIELVCNLLCKCQEQDSSQKQTQIFQSVVQTLVRFNLVSPLCSSDTLAPVRRNFLNAFLAHLTKISAKCLPTSDAQLKLNYKSSALAKFNGHNVGSSVVLPSRFLNDFEEVCHLGKGGFGQVVKVLQEVKLLAALNHPNVVRYYSSWIEFGPTLALLRDISSSTIHSQRKHRHYPEIKELSEESVTNGRSLSKLHTSFSSPNISFIKSLDGNTDDIGLESKSERNLSSNSSNNSSENSNGTNSSKNKALTKLNKNFRDNYPFTKSLSLYLQMELGSLTLRDWLTERNSRSCHQQNLYSCVDSSANEQILRQLLKALDYVHDQGIIHRDVKPSNIFLKQPGNHVLLGDFGLATLMEGDMSERNVDEADDTDKIVFDKRLPSLSIGVGTLSYSSPEQLKSHFYDQKTDMYSVGVVAFELYCPFTTTMERMHNLMELRRGEISETFQHKWPVETVFVKQLTQKNVNLRPSAKQVLQSGFFQTKNDLIGALKLQLQEQMLENDRLKQEIETLKAKLVDKIPLNSPNVD